MIEDRHVELIHAELDGELTPEQRAELSHVLLANPETRAIRGQLARLFGALEKLEDEAPPPGFSDSVLAAIGITPASAQSARRSWYTAPAFRYAAVFVGALIVSAVVLGPGARDTTRPDVSELVGTIGGHGAGRDAPIDRIALELPQVSGAINSYELDGQLVVELDLKAGQPVEIAATYAGQTVHFSLENRPDAAPERVLWLPTGDKTAGGSIEVEVYGGGQLLHREALSTSRSG
jgi:hypothetical protein